MIKHTTDENPQTIKPNRKAAPILKYSAKEGEIKALNISPVSAYTTVSPRASDSSFELNHKLIMEDLAA